LTDEGKPHEAQPSETQPHGAKAQVVESEKAESQTERIYTRSDLESSLRQGEILTGLIELRIDVGSLQSGGTPIINPIIHPYAIVVTQDCDVIQDFKPRQANITTSDKLIPSVLFCEAVPAEELRYGGNGIKGDIWKRVRQNKDERYQFLEKVLPEDDLLGEGLPELGIDFKRYFSIPTDEAYYRLKAEAKRRCRLVGPYLLHFSSRFNYFQNRVALPAEHRSE
jgi:hypothetical protein